MPRGPPSTLAAEHGPQLHSLSCRRFQQQIQGDREFSRKMEEFAVQQRLEVQKKREVGACSAVDGAGLPGVDGS